jgi:hypothetical protein
MIVWHQQNRTCYDLYEHTHDLKPQDPTISLGHMNKRVYQMGRTSHTATPSPKIPIIHLRNFLMYLVS